MLDIEKRLIALETRPVETSISNVSFTEENPTTMTTLIERVQVLESRVNNLEPSNSTLHSSVSSAPLEPPEDHRKRESPVNEPFFVIHSREIYDAYNSYIYYGGIGGSTLKANTSY